MPAKILGLITMYKEKINRKLTNIEQAIFELDEKAATLKLGGAWLWSSIDETMFNQQLKNYIQQLSNNKIRELTIDGRSITALDSTGAYLLNHTISYIKQYKMELKELTLPEKEHKLFLQIQKALNELPAKHSKPVKPNIVTQLGLDIADFFHAILDLVSFFGQFCINFFIWLKKPLSLNLGEMVRTINDTGAKGIWVAGFLCFLIGVTLAYEMSPQFITYGANVYIVNFLGISLLKEVAPLLTAIIIAGRTGASITAEIGTMQIQEEIDALQTMGISPIRRLVLPKVIGVTIAAPLMTTLTDVLSMLGGAIVANSHLDISYNLFLSRLQTYVSISNFESGIIKSIFFGFAIALVGCLCGFKVKGNANSIGEQTTKSVVLGIMLIVIFDAIFAIIFKALGM
jgi:phospholipid/cholesterol/gamma-HCH transport system permease protein